MPRKAASKRTSTKRKTTSKKGGSVKKRARTGSRTRSSKSTKNFGRTYGEKIGGFIGDAAQAYGSKVLGLGDYKITENVFLSGRPSFTSAKTKC